MSDNIIPFMPLENDQKDLTIQALISLENINRILSIKDLSERATMHIYAKNRARELKSATIFDKVFKEYENQYENPPVKDFTNVTNFSMTEIKLKCGQWTAEDDGITKVVITPMEEKTILICPHPLLIECFFTNIELGTEKVKLIFYKNNKWKDLIVDKSTIANTRKIVELSDLGLEVTSETAKDVVNYLADLTALNMGDIPYLKSTSKLGWKNKNEFVPFSDQYIFDGDIDYQPIVDALVKKGNYEAWIDETNKNMEFNIINRIIVASSFTAPLVKLIGALPFILHLWGGAGSGKTVALMMGASVWGNPELGDYLQNLDGTNVNFERISSVLNNITCFADELQVLKNKRAYQNNYDDLIMTLCQGVGRGRGTKTGGIEKKLTWRTCYIFSGEDPITKANSGGGAKNRVVEVETISQLIENGKDTSNFYRKNYGFAGEKFINIISDKEKAKEYEALHTKLMDELMESTTDKQASSLALILVADKIIAENIFDIEPLEIKDVLPFAKSKEEANIYDRAFEWLTSFIQINKIRFNDDIDINRGEVWGKFADDNSYCDFNKMKLAEKMKEATFEFDACKKYWADKGYIYKNEKVGSYTTRSRINNAGSVVVRIYLKDKQESIVVEKVTDEAELPFKQMNI